MLNDSINFLHAVPPTVGFSEGYALLCQFFVIGFGYSVVNGRKPLLRVRGQVRVGCKDVAHGVVLVATVGLPIARYSSIFSG
mgnify:CR=1 FL=1